MRKCIFCKRKLQESEFSAEHVILDSLGGRGKEDIISNVCKECNSKLGTKVDSFFVNHIVTQYQRNYYKIKGRNGVPNYLKDIDIEYADTGIKGKLLMNKNGIITGFRANVGSTDLNGRTLVYAPKKFAEGYLKAFKKEKKITSVEKVDLSNKKIPHIESVEFPEDNRDDYLRHAYPLMLKMAYEFCTIKIGELYLDDAYSEDIRKYLIEFPNIPISPTEVNLIWGEELDSKISIKLYSENKKLYVDVKILGFAVGKILVSLNADKYQFKQDEVLEIDVTK